MTQDERTMIKLLLSGLEPFHRAIDSGGKYTPTPDDYINAATVYKTVYEEVKGVEEGVTI